MRFPEFRGGDPTQWIRRSRLRLRLRTSWRPRGLDLHLPAFSAGGAPRLPSRLHLSWFGRHTTSRRSRIVAGAGLGALALIVLAVAVLFRPRSATTTQSAPSDGAIGAIARGAAQVATNLPTIVPTPDPLAACQHDPANIPAPARGSTFHTCGAHILTADGHPAQITGVSWFGMETGTYAPHGLWTRNWQAMLDQIAALGFNTVRLPFSNDALVPGQMPQNINYDINPDLAGKTSQQVMDMLIQGASDRGLKIILDRHRPTAEAQSELWYTDKVSEERWLADWVMLAQRYKGQPALLGMDLHNEPRGPATWGSDDPATDWRQAAQRAGNAILSVNPYVLIFVQGVERSGDDWYWWGGNFLDTRAAPVQLDVPGRVVYSPHDYGPGVYPQSWFSAPDFPDNLPAVWDAHWGYLAKEQLAPVVLGEFGGRSVGPDAEGVWQRALMDYAQQNGVGWLNWSFNPDSGDTGGLLSDDWLSVVQAKADLYLGHLAAPLDVGSSGVFGVAQQHLTVRGRSTSTTAQTNNVGFVLQVVNDGPTPVNLHDLELRYWFKSGATRANQQVDIDYAAIGAPNVKAVIGPADQGGVSALRLQFSDMAGTIKPYTTSGDIVVRLHKSDWTAYDQPSNFSFKPNTALIDWDHVGLYRSGALVWGSEPPAATQAQAATPPGH
jgi:endoglucanase